MIKHVMYAAIAMALAIGHCSFAEEAPAAPEQGNVTINVGDFYDSLAPYGTWIDDPVLGKVWQPNEAAGADWRPYGPDGHWVYSDAGYYWASDYKWGWAAFHYGRWTRMHDKWVWVPGTKWAPAWVSWRECDDAYGWAPLPPGCELDATAGFSWNGVHVEFGFEFGLVEADYCFVPCGHFLEIGFWRHRCGHEDRHRFYGACVVRNEYRFHDGCFHNVGCSREHVEKHWGHALEAKHVTHNAFHRAEKRAERKEERHERVEHREAKREERKVERVEKKQEHKAERIEKREERKTERVEKRAERVENKPKREAMPPRRPKQPSGEVHAPQPRVQSQPKAHPAPAPRPAHPAPPPAPPAPVKHKH